VAKPRVHEIASELGVDSKVALAKLKELGEFVKSPSSTIEPPVARKLRQALQADGAKPAGTTPAQGTSARPGRPGPARPAAPSAPASSAPTPGAAKPAPAPAPAPAPQEDPVKKAAEIRAKWVRAIAEGIKTKSGMNPLDAFIKNFHPTEEDLAELDAEVMQYRLKHNIPANTVQQ